MITALFRSDPTSRLIDQMLLRVTLITQITHISGKTMEERMTQKIVGQTNRGGRGGGDTSEATYGWGEIMQEFQQPALLMTEVVAAMSVMMTIYSILVKVFSSRFSILGAEVALCRNFTLDRILHPIDLTACCQLVNYQW